MKKISDQYGKGIVAGISLFVLATAAALVYGYSEIEHLSARVDALSSQLSLSTEQLQGKISEATTSLTDTFQKERQRIQGEIGGMQDQVGAVAGRVTDLTKLSKTDPELLAKYSKVFFLSDTYAPARLSEIPASYRYNETKHLQFVTDALPFLEDMLNRAKTDGVSIFVSSAYRSFNTQEALKGQYTVTYGAGTANSFSADQGYSEHQLGTTVDLITTGTNGQLTGFDKKPAYTWMLNNAYRYGFVLSYPKDNGYFIFEPWHWRFVGVKLATDLHNSGKYFYEMDQRDIDPYLISLFD